MRIAEEQSNDTETVLGNETLNILITECGDGPPLDQTPPDWGTTALTTTDVTDQSVTVDFSPGATDAHLAGYRLRVDGGVVATLSATATTGALTR